MNLANKLTFSRVLVIPFYVAFLCVPTTWSPGVYAFCHWIANVLIIAATVTDYYDGKIARQLGVVTSFGKLMDPLADKLIVMAGFVACATIMMPGQAQPHPLIPMWCVIVVLGREFLITGLRQIAIEQGEVIAADRLGKHKTGWQLGLLITASTFLAIRGTLVFFGLPAKWLGYFDAFYPFGLWGTLCVVMVLTVWSGVAYVLKNRGLIKT